MGTVSGQNNRGGLGNDEIGGARKSCDGVRDLE